MCEADVVNTLRLMIRNISASTSQQVRLSDLCAGLPDWNIFNKSSEINRNPQESAVFHSDWDNWDKNTSTDSIHTAHGIMLQDTWGQPPQKIEEHQTPVRTGRRSLQLETSCQVARMLCDAESQPFI